MRKSLKRLRQNAVENAVEILVSEPGRKLLKAVYEQIRNNPDNLVMHRSSLGFKVKQVLDLYGVRWPRDPLDIYRIAALNKALERLGKANRS